MRHGLPPSTGHTLKGYKLPLTPVSGGHGYYGTIAYDKSKQFTQCHICGWFYKAVASHITRKHGYEMRRYKAEYGLAQKTSLTAPIQKKTYRDSQDGTQRIANLATGRESLTHDDYVRAGQTRKSLLQKNIEGRCPDQLLDKVLQSKEKRGKLPTRRQFTTDWGHGAVKSIRTTFGNWGEAIKIAEKVE